MGHVGNLTVVLRASQRSGTSAFGTKLVTAITKPVDESFKTRTSVRVAT
jgi:hypothetical protein